MELTKTTAGSAAMRWGDVEIAPVVDWAGAARRLLPDTDRADWERHRDLLASVGAWDPATDRRSLSVHSWLVRVDGATIVVDTGAGNGKDLPGTPLFAGLTTSYLDDLARAGVAPEQVDLVVNTHLHADHVGWNTRRDGDTWIPTFPNARYVLPEPDVDYWDPVRRRAPRLAEANRNSFEQSVRPVLVGGQAKTWADSYRLGPRLTLHAAPGHTPGSSVLTLECGGVTALFVGDLFHSPLQVIEPKWASCYDEDPVLAQASRYRVLAQAASTGALVLPAHLPGAGALRVGRATAGFVIEHWHAGADR
jgi:glyoxylase-like metal-dependent hydrolase (beta-lactamase superfamily II)